VTIRKIGHPHIVPTIPEIGSKVEAITLVLATIVERRVIYAATAL